MTTQNNASRPRIKKSVVTVSRAKKPLREAPTVTKPEKPAATPAVSGKSENIAAIHGIPFVRMLNARSVVVPVPASSVIARLAAGYAFIEGESCVPRVHGNPDISPAGESPRPRPRLGQNEAGLAGLITAARYWLEQFDADRAEYHGDPELLWRWEQTIEASLTSLTQGRGADA